VVVPGIYALVLSFQRRKVNGGLLGGGTHTVFAGLANYRHVFGDGSCGPASCGCSPSSP
jgi:multiple sugar transport system permease protein